MPSYLQVGLVLDELLCAPVQQPHVGVALLHRLPAELQDQPQHAVGGRVLGPEVDGQVGHVLLRGGVLVWGGGEGWGRWRFWGLGGGGRGGGDWGVVGSSLGEWWGWWWTR